MVAVNRHLGARGNGGFAPTPARAIIIEVGVVDVRAAPVPTVVATVTVKSWIGARVAGLPKCVNKHFLAVVLQSIERRLVAL